MGKKLFLFALMLAVTATIVYAIMCYNKEMQKKEKHNSSRKENPVVVNVERVRRETMRNERIYSGTTQPWSSYDVDPKVSGRLLSLKYDIGDAVPRGALIAKIDDEEYVQDLRQAEADLDYARAKLREATGIAELKTKEFNRQKYLKEGNASSLSLYESAESAMKAQLATAEMCKAEVKRCEAKRDNAQLKVGDTAIHAEWTAGSPVRYVGTRYVDEGSLLSTGKPILSIVEIDRIKANAQIIERDYPYLKVGQKAEIRTDAYPDRVFEGIIEKIGNVLSEKTRNALAVIAIPNKDLLLRPGMFVRIRLVLSESKDTQTVPINAVLNKYGQVGVFTLNTKDGTAEFVPVKTGLNDRKRVEILSPELKTPVVTIGNHLLDRGKKVIVSELSRSQLVEKEYGPKTGGTAQ